METHEPKPSFGRLLLLLTLLVVMVAGNMLAGAVSGVLGLGISMAAATGFVYQVINGAIAQEHPRSA